MCKCVNLIDTTAIGLTCHDLQCCVRNSIWKLEYPLGECDTRPIYHLQLFSSPAFEVTIASTVGPEGPNPAALKLHAAIGFVAVSIVRTMMHSDYWHHVAFLILPGLLCTFFPIDFKGIRSRCQLRNAKHPITLPFLWPRNNTQICRKSWSSIA